MFHKTICIFWESVKPGLIPTYEPEGSSFHLSLDDRDAFIAECQSENLITQGLVHLYDVDDKVYNEIKASKNGIWSRDFHPTMGQKNDGHWEPIF